MPNINLLFVFLYISISGILVFIFPSKKKWIAILITSVLFYYLIAGYKVLILILFSLLIYLIGLSVSKIKFKTYLLSLIVLIPLVISKFLTSNSPLEIYASKEILMTNEFNWSSIFMLIGISYFSFNALSYLIDVKKRFIEPEKNFFFLLLYLIYFPTLFSGPLHRYKYLSEQFKNIKITNESISHGMRLILWGLFKNMVIGQRIYKLFKQLNTSDISGGYVLLLGFLFFIYLYCNFSSFIDFFQGVSTIFNISTKSNFSNRVYLSSSRQEFWKGWHITLNEWFRDYFFFMLAKHDRKRKYTDLILLLTFLLIALWHDLSFALILWGVFNGLWIVLERKVNIQKLPFPKFRKILGIGYHMFFSSILALIFISPSLSVLFDKILLKPSFISTEILSLQTVNISIIIVCLLVMDYHYKKAKKQRFDSYLETKPVAIRWFIYLKMIVFLLAFGLNPGIDNYYIIF